MREAVIKACLHAFTTCVRSGWPVDAGQPGSGGVTKSNRSTRARRLPDNQNQGNADIIGNTVYILSETGMFRVLTRTGNAAQPNTTAAGSAATKLP